MMPLEKRDSLSATISDLTVMNHIMNEQARKIQNREGLLWKYLSSEEIEARTSYYDQLIEKNNIIIEACLKELSKEYHFLES